MCSYVTREYCVSDDRETSVLNTDLSSGLKGFFKIQHIRSGESQGLKSITSIEREGNL